MLGNLKPSITPFARGKIIKSKFSKLIFFVLTYISLILVLAVFYLLNYSNHSKQALGVKVDSVSETKQITRVEENGLDMPSLTPTVVLSSPTPSLIPTSTPTIPQINSSQYTAEKIGDSTYKVSNVQNDTSMANVADIYNALNSYRGSRGVGNLSWDSALADLASSRVNAFAQNGGLDSHAGFNSFMNNGGFEKTGFNGLGENSAQLSGSMNGEKIIKEIFGADAPHDNNQLDPSWTHAGIAVDGNFVNVNFGRR